MEEVRPREGVAISRRCVQQIKSLLKKHFMYLILNKIHVRVVRQNHEKLGFNVDPKRRIRARNTNKLL